MTKRGKLFQDLLQFVELELTSGDLEPWAAVLSEIREHQTEERSLWLVSLYNTYDSMSSAWAVYDRWNDPLDWLASPSREEARQYPCMQERRNLHGGRVNKRLESYACMLDPDQSHPQQSWLMKPGFSSSQTDNFAELVSHTEKVWGVGRQASFEWVEFLGKVNEFPVTAGHAFLWMSSGPRHSLEILYGEEGQKPTPSILDHWAEDCRDWLSSKGFNMPWEDFETVICDFKVMQKGRYYPGRHLAALREEISEVSAYDPEGGELLLDAFQSVVPYPWNEITPGIRKDLMPMYKETGKIVSKPHREAS